MAQPLEGKAPESKHLKRGETLIDPKIKTRCFYILQSGSLSVTHTKEKLVEIYFGSPLQCFGEESLFGIPAIGAKVIALSDSQVISIPIQVAKDQQSKASHQVQTLLKGLAERVKLAWSELKTLQQAREASSCPPDHTAKVFGVIFHTARFRGDTHDDVITVGWDILKDYAVDVFQETQNRLEQALHILAKLGYAEISARDIGASTNDSASWTQIRLKNMAQIENFFEFYQNYHFKPGFTAFLRTNDKIAEITQALLTLSNEHKVDRMGMVQMPYRPTVDQMKAAIGKSFEGDQLFRLEQKGLFVKRVSTSEGGTLSFLKPEFEQMLLNWKVLKQIELWNEQGWVNRDVSAEEGALGCKTATAPSTGSIAAQLETWKPLIAAGGEIPAFRDAPPKPGELLCSICLSPYAAGQKLCATCDAELTTSKKAA